MSALRESRSKKLMRTLLAISLVLGASTLMSPAGADDIDDEATLGGFEHGGNQSDGDGAGPNVDWERFGTSPDDPAFPDAVVRLDDAIRYRSNPDEEPPTGWTCRSETTTPVGTSDNIERVYSNERLGADGRLYLDLAWVRQANPDDSETHIAFEINRDELPAEPTPEADNNYPCGITNRSTGDVLVTFNLEREEDCFFIFCSINESADTDIYAWDGNSWESANIDDSEAMGGVDFVTISDFYGLGTIGGGRFGEATVDLTGAFNLPTTGCVSVDGTVNTRSRVNMTDSDDNPGDLDEDGADRFPGFAFEVHNCGAIVVDKAAIGDQATNFTFDLTGPGNPADVIASGATDGTTGATLLPGTYTVTEQALAAWAPGAVACPDGDADGDDLPTDIDLAGQTVTCVFNNTELGQIIVDKVSTGDQATNFTFDLTGPGNPADVLASGASDATTGATLLPGTYTVTEQALAGWAPGAVSCPDGDNDGDDSPADIDLAAGQTVTCTFANTELGQIVVDKVSTGDQATNFTFDLAGPSNPADVLASGASDATTGFTLLPGTYTVTEQALAGWAPGAVSCPDGDNDGDDSPADVDLEAGQTVTCVFNNTQLGRIIVDKVAAGDQDTFFTFNLTGPGNPAPVSASGATDGTTGSTLLPGTYTVAEEALAGWIPGSPDPSCPDGDNDGDDSPADIDLEAGQTVTCVFNNVELGTIVIDKETDPDGSPQVFTYDAERAGVDVAGGPFEATDAANETIDDQVPGIFSVTEDAVAGWEPGTVSCTGDAGAEDPGAIDLGAGETVICVFTNTKLAVVTIVKDTRPDRAQDFTFTAAGPNIPGDGVFVLDDDGIEDNDQPSSRTFLLGPNPEGSGLDPYTITEAPVAGFVLDDINCTLNGEDQDLADFEVLDEGTLVGLTGRLDAGDVLTCTFVNDEQAGSATVRLKGTGDPSFALDPPVVPPFSLDIGEEVVFDDLPPGDYTLNVTAVEPGFVITGMDCGDATVGVPDLTLPGQSIVFSVVDDESVTCIVEVDGIVPPDDDDDDYDQYPGDDDFDFDTPFDDDDDADGPGTQVAGDNTNQQPTAEQPAPVVPVGVLPETATPAPADTAPQAVDTLPRTGSGARTTTMLGGLLLVMGGMATVAGRRRRANQA